MNAMNVREIKKAIKKFDRYLVTSHINPEGDSIGSQLAFSSLLNKLGKDVLILNESPVPHILQFICGTEKILKEMPQGFNFQAAVILDCPDLSRVGKVTEFITKEKVVINIDHHISNINFGHYNWVDTEASSVGEMIFELFKAFEINIEYSEAVALYVAIMTDTGSFKYTNTSSRTHRLVAELLDAGVKPHEVYGRIYETSSYEDIMLLGAALQTLRMTAHGKIAWLWITRDMLKKTRASLEGTEEIINFARSIEGVEIAILFRETGTENRVKVSFRSKSNVDVNKLASFFNGGGHVTASGCVVFGSMEDVERRILAKARELVK